MREYPQTRPARDSANVLGLPVWIFFFDPTCPAGSEVHQKNTVTKEIGSKKVISIFSVSKVTVVLTSKVPSLNDPNLMVGETATTNEAQKLQKDWSRKFCVQKEHSSQSSSDSQRELSAANSLVTLKPRQDHTEQHNGNRMPTGGILKRSTDGG